MKYVSHSTTGRLSRYFALVLVCIMVLGVVGPVAAAQGTVSGNVDMRERGIESSYEDVTIELKDGPMVIASATSAADGSYSISAVAGTYTVVATPPLVSGLPPITEPNVEISDDAAVDLDFLFVVVDDRVAIGGTVTDGAGNPVSGVDVVIFSTGPDALSTDGGSDTSAGDGTYEINVRRGYDYVITADAAGIGGLPSTYFLHAPGPQTFDAPTTIDISLPRTAATVRVENTAGDAVPSVSVQVVTAVIAGPAIGSASSTITVAENSEITNTSGAVSLLLPAGLYVAKAVPANDSGYLSVQGEMTVPSGSPKVLVLEDEPDPGKTRVTARLLHEDDTILAGAAFYVIAGGSGNADSLGQVEFDSDTVTERLQVRGPHPKLPEHLMLSTDDPVVLVEGGRLEVGDVRIPTVETIVTVLDPNGDPVPGARVDSFLGPAISGLSIGEYPASGTSHYGGSLVTGGVGHFTMWLLGGSADTYSMTVRPPRCSSGAVYDLSSKPVSFGAGTTTVVNLDGELCPPPLADPEPADGSVGYRGAGFDFNEFIVEGLVVDEWRSADDDGPIGHFVFEDGLEPDDYRIVKLSGSLLTGPTKLNIDVETIGAVRSVIAEQSNTWEPIDLTSIDDQLATLKIRVLDPDGLPVAGVGITVPMPAVRTEGLTLEGVSAKGRSSGSGTTAFDGVLDLDLFPSSTSGYTLWVTPPPEFESLSLYNRELGSSGSQITVRLVRAAGGTTTTTTTQPEETTTTTQPEETTTTTQLEVPPSEETTTTESSGEGAVTSTSVVDTTSTTVEVLSETLPRTGTDIGVLALLALMALVLGAVFLRSVRDDQNQSGT